MKRILTIAGSDSGGGAGIQTDIKTISALGGYASSVLTAVTAQNTRGVADVEFLSPDIVEKQLRAVLDDIGTDAVKIGMLGTRKVVERVAKLLEEYRPPVIVLDPVLVATSGDVLTGGSATDAIKDSLLPLATVVTPNIPEAEQLTGLSIASPDDYEAAWERFRGMGAQAVLLKGGHLTGDRLTDTLFSTGDPTAHAYTHDRIETRNTHGTGCTLSSALATFLALGQPLAEAAEQATDFIHAAIAAARDRSIGSGHGPVEPFFDRNR
ncbi:bifunctional hydroxymethylpyrimidine kinase/phosphomethylpyrimidine kinase [uncultured Rikenella sp.]|uniref:bifunctional hydroxymethylpyrimidine kinase/phosphomethylpyrimidine kinase n=1 Tax=uncultured Rikenella sp. TaxID=368003 RepID=UPI0025D045B6|nr:bifunctional hydroxymethylpyrimidine kinase/phosphomethylpyrimidine kinase [uncultured Rikenella sp.]